MDPQDYSDCSDESDLDYKPPGKYVCIVIILSSHLPIGYMHCCIDCIK